MENTFKKSESIANIAKALGQFQSEVEAIKKDATNPFFKSKYATLENIIEGIKQPLKKSGLSYTQFPTGENSLVTVLMHESGEYMESTVKMSPKDNTPQGQGSAITYMRRYSISAILGLATEDDDDGNIATKKTTKAVPEELKKKIKDTTALESLKAIWDTHKGLGAEFANLVTAQKKFIMDVQKQEQNG